MKKESGRFVNSFYQSFPHFAVAAIQVFTLASIDMVMWHSKLELHFIQLSHFAELREKLFYFQRARRTRNYFKGAAFSFQVTLRCPEFFPGWLLP